MRCTRLAAAVAAALLLVGCSTHVLSPDPEATAASDHAADPAEALVGTWALGKGNVSLVFRADGTGAILSLGMPDGDVFPNIFYVGSAILWHLADDRLTLTPVPDVLPNGAVCVSSAVTETETVRWENGELYLTDNAGDDPVTEIFVPAEEPVWYTVAAYAEALADAQFAAMPEGTDRDSFYGSFYEAFAAMYRSRS